jgi:hypothetical protein
MPYFKTMAAYDAGFLERFRDPRRKLGEVEEVIILQTTSITHLKGLNTCFTVFTNVRKIVRGALCRTRVVTSDYRFVTVPIRNSGGRIYSLRSLR